MGDHCRYAILIAETLGTKTLKIIRFHLMFCAKEIAAVILD